AHDPQVLEPVVVRDAIDVIENQRHTASVPRLVVFARGATELDETFWVQALFELRAGVCRMLDEHLAQRARERRARLTLTRIRIEVLSGDCPQLRVLAQHPAAAPARAHAQATGCGVEG